MRFPRDVATDRVGDPQEGTVSAFAINRNDGTLRQLNTVRSGGAGPTYVSIHPSGKFLYGSNRGHDSITVFSIDEKSGRLSFVETQPTQGSTPRGFGIDPTGAYLIAGNQRSDSVVVFRINQETGRLTPTGSKIDVGAPVSVKFVAAR